MYLEIFYRGVKMTITVMEFWRDGYEEVFSGDVLASRPRSFELLIEIEVRESNSFVFSVFSDLGKMVIIRSEQN